MSVCLSLSLSLYVPAVANDIGTKHKLRSAIMQTLSSSMSARRLSQMQSVQVKTCIRDTGIAQVCNAEVRADKVPNEDVNWL